jgi:hypothetical protein
MELVVALTLTALTLPIVFHWVRDIFHFWHRETVHRDRWKQESLFRQRLTFELFRSGGLWEVQEEGFTWVDSAGGLSSFHFKPGHFDNFENPVTSNNFSTWGGSTAFEFRLGLDSGQTPEEAFSLSDFFETKLNSEQIPEADTWLRFDQNGDRKLTQIELQGLEKFTLAWRWKSEENFTDFNEGNRSLFAPSPTNPPRLSASHKIPPPAGWRTWIWHPRARLAPKEKPDNSWNLDQWP